MVINIFLKCYHKYFSFVKSSIIMYTYVRSFKLNLFVVF